MLEVCGLRCDKLQVLCVPLVKCLCKMIVLIILSPCQGSL